MCRHHKYLLYLCITLAFIVGWPVRQSYAGMAIEGDTPAEAPTSEPSELSSEPMRSNSADAEEPARRLISWNHYEGKWFSFRIGGSAMGDVSGYSQNQGSIDQVGELDTNTQFRALRLTASGYIKFPQPWSYVVTGEYNGFDRGTDIRSSHSWQLSTAQLTIPLPVVGRLEIGKMKEPISLERLTGSTNLTYLERASPLDALLPSRGTGLALANAVLSNRMTWSVGWFNDLLSGSGDAANAVAARITGLPIDGGHTLLHLGVAGRWAQAPGGSFHFKARPEDNQAPDFLDTGSFAATDQYQLGLEIAWQQGPLLATGEYLADWVRSTPNGNPFFDGFYVSAAWMLSGERRPYNRSAGYFGAVSPKHPLFAGGWGALELAGRYSWTDLNDAAVHGGRFSRASLGVNWYATDNLRLEFNYGYGRLADVGTEGTTQFFQARLQFVF
jgi:phosphate-selective porin OprO/OprP